MAKLSRGKLSTYEASLLLNEDEGNVVIIMPNFGELNNEDADPIFMITPDGKFGISEYYAEYGEIDTKLVRGWILEFPHWQDQIEDLNLQFRRQLKTGN